MTLEKGSLGVVVPTYNEKESIGQLVSALLKLEIVGRIVIVDDSPNDDITNYLKPYKSETVILIRRGTKGGRGSAVIEGLRYLIKDPTKNLFLEMDADYSHPPDQIPSIAKILLDSKSDMVIASRYLSESRILNWPLSRRVFSHMANFLSRLFLRIGITDYTNGYRCYSRRAAELICSEAGIYGKGFIALSEILVRLKLAEHTIIEVPTIFVNRLRGESSVGFSEISEAFIGLCKIAGFYWFSKIKK